MLEVCDLRGRPIARQHDLFVAVEESIEGVKKFLLRSLFSSEEMDVVDQEKIGLAVAFAEFDQVVVLNRINEFVDEQLAREIHHAGAFPARANVLADRLHEMRFAQPHASINEERVVGLGRRLRDGQACRVRDLISYLGSKGL